MACAIRRQKSRHAKQRIRAKKKRIEKIIIDPPVNDIYFDPPGDGPHPHPVIIHFQIGRFDQFNPDRIRQKAVLVIGRVIVAGRQDDAHRIATCGHGGRALHRLVQQIGIAVDWHDPEHLEQLGAQADHRLPVFQHVGDARGRAGIVFQHPEIIRPGPHQINAANMRPDVVGRVSADHFGAELRIAQRQLFGDFPVRNDSARAVNIVQKRIDGKDALLQARAQPGPFARRQDARHNVERDDAFIGLCFAIDREGDAQLAEHGFRCLLPPLQFRARHGFQPFRERCKFGPSGTIAGKTANLVKRSIHVIRLTCELNCASAK
jgi:hypothetical protein